MTLTCFNHEHEALQREKKAQSRQRIWTPEKTKRGRTRNEFFKVEIPIRNLPVRY